MSDNSQVNTGLLQSALNYLKLGFSIIPIGKDKKAMIKWKEYQQRRPTPEEVRSWCENPGIQGIAIVTGAISSLVVVDTEAEADLTNLEFGNTVESLSGGGGRHFYYKHPGYTIDNKAGILPKIDIRGDGGYIIAPPSGHPSGGHYSWDKGFDKCEPNELPDWLIAKIKEESKQSLPLANNKIPKGCRNEAAAKYIGGLLKYIKPVDWESVAWQMFQKWNQENCEPPLGEEELGKIYDSITERELNNLKNAVGQEENNKKYAQSTADNLIKLLEGEDVVFFHDQFNEPYAQVKNEKVVEILKVQSKRFKHWLMRLYWKKERKTPSTNAINDVLGLISAKACFDGQQHNLENRIAFFEGAFWYDLANKEGKVIKMANGQWEVVNVPPILFRKEMHQKPQPITFGECSLQSVLEFVKLNNEDCRILFLVYLVAALVPDIPHPAPVFYGPQGSSKTTVSRLLKRLIDPSSVEVLSLPYDSVELIQQLSHHYAAYYDNIQNISNNVSDILCRAVTGEGGSKRKLFTDDDDFIYSYRRCVGLNGINVVAQKPDLLDRCILFELERVSEEERMTEMDFWSNFENKRPQIFMAMIETLSKAIVVRPTVRLNKLPRMADFAYWGYAIAEVLKIGGKRFLEAYDKNIKQQNQEILEGTPIASAVIELMKDRSEWLGQPSKLFEELEIIAGEIKLNTKAKNWPKAANMVTKRLNEVDPNLKQEGIQITHYKDQEGFKGRWIKITKRTVDAVDADDKAGNARNKANLPSTVPSTIRAAINRIIDGIDGKDGFIRNDKAEAFMRGEITTADLNPSETNAIVQRIFNN